MTDYGFIFHPYSMFKNIIIISQYKLLEFYFQIDWRQNDKKVANELELAQSPWYGSLKFSSPIISLKYYLKLVQTQLMLALETLW